jgi:hypothetical protein
MTIENASGKPGALQGSPPELLSGSGIASMNFESICAVTWSANEGDDESSKIEAE